MASAAQAARRAKAFFTPAAAWTKEALRKALTEAFEQTIHAGRAVESRVLSGLRGIEIPAERVNIAIDMPIENRDQIAERIAKAHASLAAVSCGAVEAIPVAGLVLELVTLAELNVVQVDQIAQAYGFKLGELPDKVARKLPMSGARGLLLLPILAALHVNALEREGDLDTLGKAVKGTAKKVEWQALTGRLASAAALGMLKRIVAKPFRRMIPFAGSAVAAWSGYTFTEAVGEEARKYFRDLALGTVVVRGRKVR